MKEKSNNRPPVDDDDDHQRGAVRGHGGRERRREGKDEGRDNRQRREERGDGGRGGGGGGGGATVPEITITDQGEPLFDLDWLNACAEKVEFDKRTEKFIKEVTNGLLSSCYACGSAYVSNSY
jgi:hypothetical protein